jgi:nucleoside-diphosphate-sugar epimerase
MAMNPLAARVDVGKARRVLGYTPTVSREQAMGVTLDWVRWSLRLGD